MTASLQRTLAVASYTQTRAWSLQESRQLYSNARAKLVAAARSKMEALEEQLSRSSSSGSGAASHVLRVVLCPTLQNRALSRAFEAWCQALDALEMTALLRNLSFVTSFSRAPSASSLSTAPPAPQ